MTHTQDDRGLSNVIVLAGRRRPNSPGYAGDPRVQRLYPLLANTVDTEKGGLPSKSKPG